MTSRHRQSGLLRVLRAAGGIYVGAALIACIVVYLGIVSVFTERSAAVLGTTPEGIYGHWILMTLGAALLVNIVLATILRIPRRVDALGAWCSHIGVIVTAAGCIWYLSAYVKGECLTQRTPDDWTPITSFYQTDTLALYAGRPGLQRGVMTELPGLDPLDRRVTIPLDVPAAGPDGIRLRVTGLVRRPLYSRTWANDSPNPVPAVRLEIADGAAGGLERFVLCPSYAGSLQRAGRGFVTVYHAGVTPAHLARLATPIDAADGPGMPHDILLIVTGPEIEPTAVVLAPDGGRWKGALKPGEALAVPLAGREVRLTLTEVLTHAAPHVRAVPVPGRSRDDIAARVEIAAGNFHRTTYLPFAMFESDATPQRVDVPGGGYVLLTFSRKRIDLPAMLQVTAAEYQTQRASHVPKDYICRVTILAGGQRRDDVLRLNEPVHLGRFQISQGRWDNRDLGNPGWILLLVATRPGLGVIWLGCILMCLGFPYAFYVKPLLRRRREGRA